MSEISFVPSHEAAVTPVYNAFLRDFMPKANGAYVKVYLYLLYCSHTSRASFTTRQAAQTLGMIESDVLEAIRYWKQQGVMQVAGSGEQLCLAFPDPAIPTDPQRPEKDWKEEEVRDLEGDDPLDADMTEDLDLTEELQLHQEDEVSLAKEASAEEEADALPKDHTEKEVQPVSSVLSQVPVQKVIRIEQKPIYLPEELSFYSKNAEIQRLFHSAAGYLGQILSTQSMSTLYGFYDYYRLPVDVIEYMLEYCSKNGHRDLRYMERVVQDWADHEIHSVQDAEKYTKVFDQYLPIMKAMGIRRYPTEEDCSILERMMTNYEMPMELMLEAAKRMKANTNNPNFNYMDGILMRWHRAKVHTMQDVIENDRAFNKEKQKENRAEQKEKIQRTGSKKNRFLNYDQRTDVDWKAWEEEVAELSLKKFVK